MIKIHFFASLSERLDCSNVNLEYAGEHTVAEIKQRLLEKGHCWSLLDEKSVQVAVNQTLSKADAQINDGDEIAFFPPVTGG
ncbi:MAG: molybdopterin synthase sulfur carrier subunit [Candidatus Endobugula sp.]|jgi:molybdopterin synthase sulfur carrier subunit